MTKEEVETLFKNQEPKAANIVKNPGRFFGEDKADTFPIQGKTYGELPVILFCRWKIRGIPSHSSTPLKSITSNLSNPKRVNRRFLFQGMTLLPFNIFQDTSTQFV